ncbi:MAG: DUF4838 domain-containing protein [Verrucomicrobiales bacterium]|nr:DUF4838 domain-containing protein [Verrucomicrobiales bacterium]
MATSTAADPGVEPSGRYFRDWLLCGPFPATTEAKPDIEAIRLPGMESDHLEGLGGEANARPRAGQKVTVPGGGRVWSPFSSSTDALDLDAAVTTSDRVVAYAYREILSPAPVACILALGSNDGARVWLNGELILDQPGPRGLKLDHHLVPVALRQGTNALMIKVEERGNRWALACRLLPLTHQDGSERLRLFDVLSKEDGTAIVRPRQSAALTSLLLKSAVFEAFPVSATNQVVWSAPWVAREGPISIGVDARTFGQYGLRLKAEFADGNRRETILPFTAGRRVEHVLFEQGKTRYRLVVGAQASESERWAASELRRWIQDVSGVSLADGSEADATDDHVIVVGWNSRSERLLGPGAGPLKDGDESFTYRSVGPALVLWGGRQRGTLYAVMSFLEREMGVRFYTPRVTVAPRKARYVFTGLFHSEAPGVRVRNDFYYEAFDPVWAARNRINGSMSHRVQPGGVESYWSVHTFFPLMPPEEFFEKHPEYYSLLDGKRTADHAQLCLTHPDVLRIITERIRRRMRESPEYLIYDVSQNDWANPCQCRDCQAIVDREGSQSGPVIQFVNQVADQVKAEFPDKFIGTLAYQYTRKPPRTVKPRENVVVRFCSIECCFAHDFESCPENRSFVEDMNGWAAIAPHIYIWDYVVNFSHYLLPYPNFRVLKPNIQFFRDHQAIGIMEQAAYQSRGGEFAELRSYLIAKLLWNPEADVEAVIDDFMFGYYGRAGQFVRAYFHLLHGRLTPETHIHLGLQPDDKLFSDDFVREAEALFDRADAVADTEEIRQRVDLARLPILYLKCKRVPAIARQDGSYARFNEIVRRENVINYAEAGEPHRKAFHAEVEAAP